MGCSLEYNLTVAHRYVELNKKNGPWEPVSFKLRAPQPQVYNPQLLRGAVAHEPILHLLLHLLRVFKAFVVLFLNSALFCLVDCAHLVLTTAHPKKISFKKIATNIL